MPAANLDTSVLVDFLLCQMADRLGLDGLRDDVSEPAATVSLFEDGTQSLVVGGKVDGEFGALCDRHDAVYEDILDWIPSNPDTDITEYDLSERRERVTPNDRSFFRFQIECHWSGASTVEQLLQFREIRQEVQTLETGFGTDSTRGTTSSTTQISRQSSRDSSSTTTWPS